jgi:hypothetical protein
MHVWQLINPYDMSSDMLIYFSWDDDTILPIIATYV